MELMLCLGSWDKTKKVKDKNGSIIQNKKKFGDKDV